MKTRGTLKGRTVDLRNWKRRQHFELFRHYERPFFSVCADVDVTRVWEESRGANAPSFFLASLYLMLKAANEIEAFRMRMRKEGVWLHDAVAVGPTIQREDGTFAFSRFEFQDQFEAFAAKAQEEIADTRRRKALARAQAHLDDIVYQSTLPWLRFTSFTNALGGDDSIPRFVFGKCVRENGAMKMPVAVEVHHALVDGSDVGRFFDLFQTGLTG